MNIFNERDNQKKKSWKDEVKKKNKEPIHTVELLQ